MVVAGSVVGVVVGVCVVVEVVVVGGVGVGFVDAVVVGDVAMTEGELLDVLGDVLELQEDVPPALVPLLYALQPAGWYLIDVLSWDSGDISSWSVAGPWASLSRTDSESGSGLTWMVTKQSESWSGPWSLALAGSWSWI